MTLKELYELERLAAAAESDGQSKLTAAREIADMRNKDKPLQEALELLRRYDHSEEKTKSLAFAETHLRDDLLRIAEVRLEADARALTAKARALRKQITTYLDQEPESKVA